MTPWPPRASDPTTVGYPLRPYPNDPRVPLLDPDGHGPPSAQVDPLLLHQCLHNAGNSGRPQAIPFLPGGARALRQPPKVGRLLHQTWSGSCRLSVASGTGNALACGAVRVGKVLV
jgi:hypothetical protein